MHNDNNFVNKRQYAGASPAIFRDETSHQPARVNFVIEESRRKRTMTRIGGRPMIKKTVGIGSWDLDGGFCTPGIIEKRTAKV
jgi:hypothetical protein